MTHFSSAVSTRPAQDAPQKHNPHQLQWPCFLAVAKGHPFAVPLLAQPIAALTPTIGLDSPSSTWGGVDDSGKMPYHHTYIDTQLLKIAAVENRLIRRKDTRFQ